MTQEDIIWLAGYLEGEGCFVKGYPNSPNFRTIDVQSTDYDIILRVANIFGNNRTIYSNKIVPNRKPSWRVRAVGVRAIEIMKLILPYMGERRSERIRDCIETWDSENYRVIKDRVS